MGGSATSAPGRLLFRRAAVGWLLWSCAAAAPVASAADGPRAIATEIVVAGLATEPAEVTLEDCLGRGTCWTVASVLQLGVTLSLADHSVTCTRSCRAPLSTTFLVRDDATYEVAGGLALRCASGAIAEMGSGTVTRRGRKMLLHPDDPVGLRGALTSCLEGAVPNFRFALRPSPDGTLLHGRTVVQGTVHEGEGTAHLVYRLRHKGLSVANGGTPVLGKHLRECPPVFVVRCELRVDNP